MSESAANTVIDRIVVDDELRGRVVRDGAAALAGFDLELAEARAIASALRADDGAEPFTHLRRQVSFEPLFAAASASATKIG